MIVINSNIIPLNIFKKIYSKTFAYQKYEIKELKIGPQNHPFSNYNWLNYRKVTSINACL